jgi:hypothetical protein
VISSPATFLLRTDRGETGPFSARHLALMAISKGIDLSAMIIRGAADPEDVAFPADSEPQIVAEYARRKPASRVSTESTVVTGSRESQALEVAFSGAVKDGVLKGPELEMLTNLVVTLGMESNPADAANRLRSMALERQVRIQE